MKKLDINAYRRPMSVLVLMLADAGGLLFGLVVAAYLVRRGLFVEDVLLFAPILLTLWIAIFAAHDLYDRAHKRRKGGALLGAIFWGAGLLTFGSIVYPQVNFQLSETLLAAVLVFLVCGGFRFLYEGAVDRVYRRGLGRAPAVIVGEERSRSRVR